MCVCVKIKNYVNCKNKKYERITLKAKFSPSGEQPSLHVGCGSSFSHLAMEDGCCPDLSDGGIEIPDE